MSIGLAVMVDKSKWSKDQPLPQRTKLAGSSLYHRWCRELTTLWVARLDDGVELKVTDPKEQQGDVEEEEAEGEERRDGVDWGGRQAECC